MFLLLFIKISRRLIPEVTLLGNTFYEDNPDLREYFESLPIDTKNRILESGAEISTLGELMQIAEHVKATN
jgi:hypothetical protein